MSVEYFSFDKALKMKIRARAFVAALVVACTCEEEDKE